MAAALPIIKVVGVALSAKAAIDGIKEGNIFQTVIGAVGAYYGVSSLASTATAAGSTSVAATAEGAAQTAATAGADTAAQVAAQTAAKGAAETGALEAIEVGATKLGGNSIMEGLAMKEAGQAAGQAAAKTGIDAMNQSLQEGAAWVKDGVDDFGNGVKSAFGGQATAAGGQAAGQVAGQVTGQASKGLLSKMGSFANENPFVVQAGLNLGGGYMQGKAQEKIMEKEEQLMRERYGRIGSPVDISRASAIRWDPQNRRFSQEVA